MGVFNGRSKPHFPSEITNYYARSCSEPATSFQGLRRT
jgi:hypothetical protein